MPDLRAVPPSPPAGSRGARVTIGVAHLGLAAVWLVLGVRVIPSFEDMFADFGASLPWLTMMVLERGWPVVGLLVDLAGFACAFIPPRWLWLGFALATVSALLLVVTGMALYAPIFEMARNVGP